MTPESTDGAHLGYGMEAALKGVLGGEEPPKRMDVNEMRAYIESAPDVPQSYDDGGRAIAKMVLGFFMRHPEAGELPSESESEYDWSDFKGEGLPPLKREGLSDYMKRIEPGLLEGNAAYQECTDFQWGWGVNAARRCLEMPPVANPAIVELG